MASALPDVHPVDCCPVLVQENCDKEGIAVILALWVGADTGKLSSFLLLRYNPNVPGVIDIHIPF